MNLGHSNHLIGIAFFLVLLVGISGCSGNEPNIDKGKSNEPMVVMVTKDKLDIEGQLEALKVIRLENREESLIGQIDKIIVSKSGIFVLDIRNTKSLFHFDAEGKFKYKLSDVGTGPSEFYLPFDFSINEADGLVYILDVNQRKLMKFDLKNGNHIGNEPIDFQAKSFSHLMDNLFAFQLDARQFSNDKKEKLLIIYDVASQQTISSFLPEYSTADFLPTRTYFTLNDNEVLFSKSMHDTIYQYSEDKFEPSIILDFQGKNVTDEVKSLDMMEARQSFMEGGIYYHNGSFSKSEDKLLFNWLDDTMEYLGYYNASTQNFYNLSFSEIPIEKAVGVYDNYFVSYANAYDFSVDSEYYLADDDQNPYVLLFKLK